MNNFADIIILQYPYNGETKSGLIRLNLRLSLDEYGDKDIEAYVENNPAVLTKIDSLRNKLLS